MYVIVLVVVVVCTHTYTVQYVMKDVCHAYLNIRL